MDCIDGTWATTHQQSDANGLQQFLAGGASNNSIVNVVHNAALAANYDADRQSHHFFNLAAQRPVFYAFFMQPGETAPRSWDLASELRQPVLKILVRIVEISFHKNSMS